ncbi:MAG: signal peptidase I [Planctomycetaceae bacterium]
MAEPNQRGTRDDDASGTPDRRADRGDRSPASKPADSRAPRNKTKSEAKPKRQDGTRETVESIVIAFILAFLFRTFEAEAFVIPTGSMAPTLYGRHIDVECPQCGYHYAVGASEEVDADGYLDGVYVETSRCPNCRFETRVKNLPSGVEFLPVFKGDRILVNKFPFEFWEPSRWDVVVFKYPETPTINYIKRMVGLPGETIEIRQGDIYVKTADQPEWRIARKDDPDKQRELQILVYDDRHPEKLLHEMSWPERWAAVQRGDGSSDAEIAGWLDDDSGWRRDPESRSFHIALAAAPADREPRWIRYRHFVPDPGDWEEAAAALDQQRPANLHPERRLQLVSDFTGYNAFSTRVIPGRMGSADSGIRHGLFWVGDLTLDCRVEVGETAENGRLIFELNEGDRWYRATLDPATGEAALSYLDEESRAERQLATGATRLRGGGTHDVSFANVDDRLCLWIDGTLVEFDETTEYPPMGGMGGLQTPTIADLAPAGVASRGVEATVSRLLLERDIYYRGDMQDPRDQFHRDEPPAIYEYGGGPDEESARALWSKLGNPAAWFSEYERNRSATRTDRDVAFEFPLGEDEFFMLGDNSPKSKDSRLWSNTRRAVNRHAVPRSALVGKAFFIYWPHGKPFLNDGRGFPDDGDSALNNDYLAGRFYHQQRTVEQQRVERAGRIVVIERVETSNTDYPSFRIPFYPQFGRMERIR